MAVDKASLLARVKKVEEASRLVTERLGQRISAARRRCHSMTARREDRQIDFVNSQETRCGLPPR